MILFLLVTLYFLTLFVIIEVASRHWNIATEYSRKYVHIVAGISAAYLPFFMPFYQIALLAFMFIMVMLISKHLHIFNSVHGVKRRTYGEVFFPISIFIIALAVPNKDAYLFAMLTMALSDGLAGLAGARFGKVSYSILGAHKTYLGSTVFFVMTLVIGLILNLAPIVLILAAILTLTEAVSRNGFDNLIVPTAAAVLYVVTFN